MLFGLRLDKNHLNLIASGVSSCLVFASDVNISPNELKKYGFVLRLDENKLENKKDMQRRLSFSSLRTFGSFK